MKINLPTKITISRIILAIILLLGIIVLYYLDFYSVLDISSFNIKLNNDSYINIINIIILVIFLIASFTDFLDGYLARSRNLVTDLGKFLDPLADKMLINGLMVFLCVNFSSLTKLNNGTNQITMTFPFFAVIIMVIRDLCVDSLRFMAAKKGKVIAANIYGKIKTVTQMIAISAVLLNDFPFFYFDYNFPTFLKISDILVYIACFFSLLSGIIYFKDNFKNVFDEDK